MDKYKLSNPDELLSLTAEQLFQRLRPILRAGGLFVSSQLLARVRQNLSSVAWELAEKWKANPRLGEREVAFSEYLAATLCNTLRALDRKQNRHLYDSNGAYQADREPLQFDDLDGKHFRFPPLAAVAPDALDPGGWAQSLERTAVAGGIARPSIAALIHNITKVESGQTKTPYRLARADGLSTTDARDRPATSAFIAIAEFVAAYAATPVATAVG